MDALKDGFKNLDKHYDNLKKFGVSVIVCLNRFNTDTDEEIAFFQEYCENKGYCFAISDAYANGGKGAISLAKEVLNAEKGNFHFLCDISESIISKIEKICKEIYGASKVNFSDNILDKIENFEKNGMSNLPICVAKTQYSFSDDPKAVGVVDEFEVTVKDIRLYAGAGFITVLLGDIMTMPGLSKVPNCEKIDVVDGEIINLS